LRRYRSAFELACDRLRNVTMRLGCDTPIARAVLWNNFDRTDMALDQIKDAISCRPAFRHLYVIQAWLAMHNLREGLLNADEISRIMRNLEPAFETTPDTFNPYFLRAILYAAGGRISEARGDLRQCQDHLGDGRVPSDVQVYNEWCARAKADVPFIEFLDYTQTLLDTLPVPPGRRMRLAEDILKALADPEAIKGLDENMLRTKKGWTNHRLAKLYAERKDRGKTLQFVIAALEQKLPNLTPAHFKNDPAFADWNNDEEFQKVYAMFEQ
jgi:hypothetical protein